MSRLQALAALFDKAVQGVIDQGCQSSLSGTCQYRGPNDTKCAVGHLLTDDQITKYKVRSMMTPDIMPGALVRELIPNEPTAHAIEFLLDMQDAHDGVDTNPRAIGFLSQFKKRCAAVADKWDLTRFITVKLT